MTTEALLGGGVDQKMSPRVRRLWRAAFTYFTYRHWSQPLQSAAGLVFLGLKTTKTAKHCHADGKNTALFRGATILATTDESEAPRRIGGGAGDAVGDSGTIVRMAKLLVARRMWSASSASEQ